MVDTNEIIPLESKIYCVIISPHFGAEQTAPTRCSPTLHGGVLSCRCVAPLLQTLKVWGPRSSILSPLHGPLEGPRNGRSAPAKPRRSKGYERKSRRRIEPIKGLCQSAVQLAGSTHAAGVIMVSAPYSRHQRRRALRHFRHIPAHDGASGPPCQAFKTHGRLLLPVLIGFLLGS